MATDTANTENTENKMEINTEREFDVACDALDRSEWIEGFLSGLTDTVEREAKKRVAAFKKSRMQPSEPKSVPVSSSCVVPVFGEWRGFADDDGEQWGITVAKRGSLSWK